jgi:hypothetical protein
VVGFLRRHHAVPWKAHLATICQLSVSSNLRFCELGCANNRGDAAKRKLYQDFAAGFTLGTAIAGVHR